MHITHIYIYIYMTRHIICSLCQSCQGRPRPQPWTTAASPHGPSGSLWARDAFVPRCLRCQGRFGSPTLPGAWKSPDIGGTYWGYLGMLLPNVTLTPFLWVSISFVQSEVLGPRVCPWLIRLLIMYMIFIVTLFQAWARGDQLSSSSWGNDSWRFFVPRADWWKVPSIKSGNGNGNYAVQ